MIYYIRFDSKFELADMNTRFYIIDTLRQMYTIMYELRVDLYYIYCDDEYKIL